MACGEAHIVRRPREQQVRQLRQLVQSYHRADVDSGGGRATSTAVRWRFGFRWKQCRISLGRCRQQCREMFVLGLSGFAEVSSEGSMVSHSIQGRGQRVFLLAAIALRDDPASPGSVPPTMCLTWIHLEVAAECYRASFGVHQRGQLLGPRWVWWDTYSRKDRSCGREGWRTQCRKRPQ